MNLITTKLAGGLGNILFQIAASYGYARKYNRKPIFYTNTHIPQHKHITSYLDNILRKVDMHVSPIDFTVYKEPNFHYNDIPEMTGNVMLDGYFQSEKYFESIKEEIKDLFKIDDNTKSFLKFKYGKLLEGNTCSLHVRRGDYLHLQDYHVVQKLDYYKDCVDKFDKDTRFFVFSDDIKWCSNAFGSSKRLVYVDNNLDYQDLYLQSQCNHHIIANSSFSWWGAYLNNNEEKIIYAPSKWFGPVLKEHNTKDLYCKGWNIV
jgi:hypothetical protein